MAPGGRKGVVLQEPIDVRGACNDHCVFCPIPASDTGPRGHDEIKRLISAAAEAGAQEVLLMGGEPTLRPDVTRLIRYARTLGVATVLRTNARLFSYQEYREKMVRAGLAGVEVPIHGPADIHNATTRDESHAQAITAVKGLVAAGVAVTVRLTVTSMNLETVGKTVAWAKGVGASGLVFIFPAASGDALASPEIIPDMLKAAQAVSQAIVSHPATASFKYQAEGFPVCLVGEIAHVSGNTKSTPYGWSDVALKPPACAGCLSTNVCGGVSAHVYATQPQLVLQAQQIGTLHSRSSLMGVPILTSEQRRPPETERLDIAHRYPDTALITLMIGQCDLNCIFCETPQGDTIPALSTALGVRAGLESMAGRVTGVYLTGGEPSGLSWLVATFEHAKRLGYERIQMQSHVGPASAPEVAERWAAAGLTAVDVPLYGPDAQTHQAITKTQGSFDRTLAGMKQLQHLGLKVCIHMTVFQSNLGALAESLRFFDSLGASAVYIQIANEVGPPGTYERVSPSPEQVGRSVVAACDAYAMQTPLFLSDLAPCHVPGHEDKVLQWQGTPTLAAEPLVLPYSEWLMVFSAGKSRVKGSACSACARFASCDGIPREALELFGEQVFHPYE